jgi:hypothetical protein
MMSTWNRVRDRPRWWMPISERGCGPFLRVTGGGRSIGRVLIRRRARDPEET